MNRRRNLIILGIALVAIIVIGAIAARPKGAGVTARVVTVAYTRYQTKLPETGVVQRPQTQVLAALVTGNIGQIYARPGQRVAAGQLLATISNPQLANAEATAHDAYLAAQGRARTAMATNSTLPTQNRSSVVQAEATLQQARFNLNQAITDQRSGAQSGLGYGGTSASQQRAPPPTPTSRSGKPICARRAGWPTPTAISTRRRRSPRMRSTCSWRGSPKPRSPTIKPNATVTRSTRRSRARRRYCRRASKPSAMR